jgi:hypothetical protein
LLRGRSERTFGTLQDRLGKELGHAGITDIEAANAFIRQVYFASARSICPPQCPLRRCAGRRGLGLHPRSHRVRPHFVKARAKVRVYPGPCLSRRHALFHRPRCIGRYDENGTIRDGKSAA